MLVIVIVSPESRPAAPAVAAGIGDTLHTHRDPHFDIRDVKDERAVHPLETRGFDALWSAIGIRASAVVMMAESQEFVVLTAVAGHRLPHCWRDDVGLDGGGRFQFMFVVGGNRR